MKKEVRWIQFDMVPAGFRKSILKESKDVEFRFCEAGLVLIMKRKKQTILIPPMNIKHRNFYMHIDVGNICPWSSELGLPKERPKER